ncbi:hypothetical protein F5B20DRAFT_586415 [Whalleya microplaca]|nr:hypothetical protein F5B20DRAFT_586415 [Whalleya microplaca]
MSPRQYERTSGPSEIASLYLACDFLESLCIDGNVVKDTLVATPDSQIPPLPSSQHERPSDGNQERPVNASLADGSSNAQNKRCQTQWQLLHWFIQKIDVYYQKLQCPGIETLPVLRQWLTKYRRSKKVREVGLHTLRDILQDKRPLAFDEVLCAMLVQHAVFVWSKNRRLVEGGIGSALSGWRNMFSPTSDEQSALDFVFKQITIYDSSTPGDSNPAWPDHQTLFNSPVQETGSQFTSGPFYPMSINIEESIYGIAGFDADASSWAQNPMTSFPPRTQHLSMTPHPTRPSEFDPGPYSLWRPGESSTTMGIANPFTPNPFDLQQPFQRQPHLSGSLQVFQPLLQPPHLIPRSTHVNNSPLNQSPPFRIFMNFVDEFKNLGGLLHLFSRIHTKPVYLTNPPTNSNTQASEIGFSMNAETYLFQPLKASRHIEDPLEKAIVSTARSFTLVRGLRSFKDIEDYIIHLSINLLPSPEPCRKFVQVVLQTCIDIAPEVDGFPEVHHQNHTIEQLLDKVTGQFLGGYYPTQLLQPKIGQSRDYERLQPGGPSLSSSSSSHPTSPLGNSATSNRRNNRGTSTIASTTYEHTGTTPSVGSELRCPHCSQSFTGKYAHQSLSRHKRNHKDRMFKCPHPGCPKALDSRTDNIRTHCKNVHGKLLPPGAELWNVMVPLHSDTDELQ